MNVLFLHTSVVTITRSKELNRLTQCNFINHKFPTHHTNNNKYHTTITEIMWLNRSTLTAHKTIRSNLIRQKKIQNSTRRHILEKIIQCSEERIRNSNERFHLFSDLIFFLFLAQFLVAVFSVHFWLFQSGQLFEALPYQLSITVFMTFSITETQSWINSFANFKISNSNS